MSISVLPMPCVLPHMQTLSLSSATTVVASVAAATSPSSASSSVSAAAAAAALLMPAPAPRIPTALAQPSLLRNSTAPVTSSSSSAQSRLRNNKQSAVLASAVQARVAAPEVIQSLSAPTAAHVLQDYAHVELSKRLQSRLATLGIGANMVSVDVRANAPSSSEIGAPQRTFTLTLSGKLQLSLGSLFNILIAGFLKSHPQITTVERQVRFKASWENGDNSTAGEDEESDTPCVDSPAILQIKIQHLAKLIQKASYVVAYTGDGLCQGTAAVNTSSPLSALARTASTISSATSSSANSTSNAASSSLLLNDLSAPHPPSVLKNWLNRGLIKHIVNENMDGWFNPTPKSGSQGSGSASSMSDEDQSSVCSSSSGDSDDFEQPLGDEVLSEMFGNKFKEVCSLNCGNGAAGNASVYYRNFEVKRIRFSASLLGQRGIPANGLIDPVEEDPHLTGRHCSFCGGALRDTLVEWNESLPRAVLQRSAAQAARSDLNLVFGSVMRVSPLCDLPNVSRANTPLVIVTPSTTGKDVDCLEGGGILIRKDPATVLQLLQNELKKLLPPRPVAATIVRKLSRSSTGNSSIASGSAAPVMAIPACVQKATSLNHQSFKKRHSAVLSQSQLLALNQRRGSASPLSGLGKPAMLRSSTAAASFNSMRRNSGSGSMMRLSANLPPFPRLDDDGDDDEIIPAAAPPSRATTWSGDVPSTATCSLLQAASLNPNVGLGSISFQGLTQSHLSLPASLQTPNAQSVSSPVPMSRYGSLSPPSWIFPAAIQTPSPPRSDDEGQLQDQPMMH